MTGGVIGFEGTSKLNSKCMKKINVWISVLDSVSKLCRNGVYGLTRLGCTKYCYFESGEPQFVPAPVDGDEYANNTCVAGSFRVENTGK
jgi:hypothetical protein